MKSGCKQALIFCFVCVNIAIISAVVNAGNKPDSLWPLCETLGKKRMVDLTHSFAPGIPKWKGYPDEKRRDLYVYDKDGFWVEQYTFAGQWGTHIDSPAHFHRGLMTVDDIPPRDMIAPLVILDVSEQVLSDPDYLLSLEDVKKREAEYGKVPERAFVAMRSDWSKRWPDSIFMQNADERGVMHFPGWSIEALKYLFQYRNILAIGHETSDTDGGVNVSQNRYPAETFVLGENHYQIELLANLYQVPVYGSIAFISFPKPKNSAGFPARVIAVIPQDKSE